MLRAQVDEDFCQACQPCLARAACRVRAIFKLEADEPARVDQSLCNGCGECISACPHLAVSLRSPYARQRTCTAFT